MDHKTTNKENLLVVDDNHQNVKLICTMLNQEDYNLAVALNAKDALKILQTLSISLVLLDVMMPEMDGFELCSLMKNDSQLRHIPVIFVSALDDAENITKAYHAGASDYLHKPVKSVELFAKVRTQLELMKYRSANEVPKQSSDQPTHFPDMYQLAKTIKSRILPSEALLKQFFEDGFIVNEHTLVPDSSSFHCFNKRGLSYVAMTNWESSTDKNNLLSLVNSETLKVIALNVLPTQAAPALDYFIRHLDYIEENTADSESTMHMGLICCNKQTQTLELVSRNIPIVYYSFRSDSYEVITSTIDEKTGATGSYPIEYNKKDRIYMFNRKSMLLVKHILKHINQKQAIQKEKLSKVMMDEQLSSLISLEL